MVIKSLCGIYKFSPSGHIFVVGFYFILKNGGCQLLSSCSTDKCRSDRPFAHAGASDV